MICKRVHVKGAVDFGRRFVKTSTRCLGACLVAKTQRVYAGRKKDAGLPISREARAGINGGSMESSIYRPAV